jgi:uncharacterized membrane protein
VDPQLWLVGIIVILEAYWPILAVAAVLVLGPLLGFVIVAVIGAIRTAVAPHHDDDETVGTDEIFSGLEGEHAGLVRDRNDSI